MAGNSVGKKIFDFGTLRRVLKFAAPYKTRFYISLALAIILAFFTIVRPILIQDTINDYINQGIGGSDATKMRMEELIIWITVIQIGLLILESALRFYFSFLSAWLGQTVVKDLRVKVYRKVLGLNLSQFDKTPIGTLIHTGDYKIDDTPVIGKPYDLDTLRKYGDEGVLALLADSTNATVPGRTPSEQAVIPAFREIFEETPGRLFVATFSSSITPPSPGRWGTSANLPSAVFSIGSGPAR